MYLNRKPGSIGILNHNQWWNHLYSLQFPVSAMEVLGETSTNFTFLSVFMLTRLTFSCVQREILKGRYKSLCNLVVIC